MKTKFIGWAYSTSDIAHMFGHYLTGCWYLQIGDDIEHASVHKDTMLSIAGMKEYKDLPWGIWSMHEDQ